MSAQIYCFSHLSTRWQKSIKDVAEAKGIPRIIITQTDGSTDITDIVTAG